MAMQHPPAAPREAAAPAWATPKRLLQLSVAVAIATIALKTLAWVVSGSVGLLSDALESLVNLVGALFALGMVTIAQRPADDGHPYGHAKAEYFSSGFEGLLIFGAAAAIIWAAAQRLLAPQPLAQVGLGLVLSVASSALNGGLAWLMMRSARAHRSLALEAGARHLYTDVWTSAGVVIGLLAAMATGWLWLDAAVALAVALNILKEGAALVWRSSQGLMDQALDPGVVADIEQRVQRFCAPWQGQVYSDRMASRRAGQRSFVELHLHMPADWSLGRAYQLRSALEAELMAAVPGLVAAIEVLPTGTHTEYEKATRSEESPA